MYKLYIDDIRTPKRNDYIVARSSSQAIDIMIECGIPGFISFDHDLGGDDTSIKVINWLTEQLMESGIKLPTGFAYKVHSANPVGKMNIQFDMDNIIKHFGEQ